MGLELEKILRSLLAEFERLEQVYKYDKEVTADVLLSSWNSLLVDRKNGTIDIKMDVNKNMASECSSQELVSTSIATNSRMIENKKNDIVPTKPAINAWEKLHINNVGNRVRGSGWVRAIRKHKNVVFYDVGLNVDSIIQLKSNIDLGLERYDYIEFTGIVSKNDRGNILVGAPSVLERFPDLNQSKFNTIELRYCGLDKIREVLRKYGFTEFITPVLTKNFFGGTSRPFLTYSNKSRDNLFLKVSSEPHLYGVIGYDYNSIYEITPSFRNESRSNSQTSEFYLIEFYSCVINLMDIKKIVVDLLNIGLNNKLNDVKCYSFKSACDHFLSENEIPKCDEEFKLNQIYKKLVSIVSQPIFISDIPFSSSPFYKGDNYDCNRLWLIGHGLDIAELAENEMRASVVANKIAHQAKNDKYGVKRNYDFMLSSLKKSNIPPVYGCGISYDRLVEFWNKANKAEEK